MIMYYRDYTIYVDWNFYIINSFKKLNFLIILQIFFTKITQKKNVSYLLMSI